MFKKKEPQMTPVAAFEGSGIVFLNGVEYRLLFVEHNRERERSFLVMTTGKNKKTVWWFKDKEYLYLSQRDDEANQIALYKEKLQDIRRRFLSGTISHIQKYKELAEVVEKRKGFVNTDRHDKILDLAKQIEERKVSHGRQNRRGNWKGNLPNRTFDV